MSATPPPRPPPPRPPGLRPHGRLADTVRRHHRRDHPRSPATPSRSPAPPGAGLGHPACYLPGIPVIEVDGNLLGVTPATARPASPADRERYPVLWGALTHEGGHAAHSKVCPPPAGRARQLVRGRPPAGGVPHGGRPGHPPPRRPPLAARHRQQAHPRRLHRRRRRPGTPREAGSAAALVLARRDAGILEAAETADVAAQVEKAIGAGALKRLEATWTAAHQVADDDARTMVRLARRWCRILGLDPDAAPPAPIETGPSDLLDAIRDAIEAISAAVEADFTPPPPFPPGKTAERDAENAARTDADQRRPRGLRPPGPRRRPSPAPASPATTETPPPAASPAPCSDATAGTRDTVTVTSQVPPGRLRMRQVLAAHAQRAAGAVPTAEPFTRTRSRRVPAPPLRVGIACDISGSMRAFTGPVASAAWILARAASALPAATTATVLYGEQVHALTRPGQAPARVTDFAAPDGTEQLCRAIDALDGALGLSRPGTARLLAIVSDTYHTPEEIRGGQRRITRLPRTGCGVIILRPETPTTAPTTGPTARSSTSTTPPTPSTPSPAPPPAPSPPDTRPRGRARPARPRPRKGTDPMTSTPAPRTSPGPQPDETGMNEEQREEFLLIARRAADPELRAAGEAAHSPSPEDLAAARDRARDAALAALSKPAWTVRRPLPSPSARHGSRTARARCRPCAEHDVSRYPARVGSISWHLLDDGYTVTWAPAPAGCSLTLDRRGPRGEHAAYRGAGPTMQRAWDEVRAQLGHGEPQAATGSTREAPGPARGSDRLYRVVQYYDSWPFHHDSRIPHGSKSHRRTDTFRTLGPVKQRLARANGHAKYQRQNGGDWSAFVAIAEQLTDDGWQPLDVDLLE